jgi:hypothetical protein
MNYFNAFSSSISHPRNTTLSLHADEGAVKFTDILIMYFILMVSGNPFFVQHFQTIIVCSVIIPLLHFFSRANKKIAYNTVFIFVFLLGYELMHAIVYELDYSLTIFKLFLVLLLAFSVVQIFGNRFVRVLIDTMVVISLISFLFTALCYIPSIKWEMYDLALDLFPMYGGFKAYVTPTFLIYTLHPQYYLGEFNYVRNAGIFWESGAFAVFLNLTLYLGYISRPIARVGDLFDRKSVILIIAVITTASTMGFLALILILTFFTLQLRTPLKFIFLILVGILGYMSFVSIDFMGEKISTQLEESDERNNRFGAARMDWEDIKERPIIGSSRRIEVIYGDVELSNEIRRPNGLTNFFREYGLIYFTVYFVLVYLSFKRIFFFHNNYYKFAAAFFGVILLWLLSFSELIFDLPFFKALIFLSSVYFPQHEWEDAAEQHEGFVDGIPSGANGYPTEDERKYSLNNGVRPR